MGMSRLATLVRLELPLAWPVIMTGVRVSAQMLMGIAAIAAFALGPGLGGYIFSGISRYGGANATNSVVAGTVGNPDPRGRPRHRPQPHHSPHYPEGDPCLTTTAKRPVAAASCSTV